MNERLGLHTALLIGGIVPVGILLVVDRGFTPLSVGALAFALLAPLALPLIQRHTSTARALVVLWAAAVAAAIAILWPLTDNASVLSATAAGLAYGSAAFAIWLLIGAGVRAVANGLPKPE